MCYWTLGISVYRKIECTHQLHSFAQQTQIAIIVLHLCDMWCFLRNDIIKISKIQSKATYYNNTNLLNDIYWCNKNSSQIPWLKKGRGYRCCSKFAASDTNIIVIACFWLKDDLTYTYIYTYIWMNHISSYVCVHMAVLWIVCVSCKGKQSSSDAPYCCTHILTK